MSPWPCIFCAAMGPNDFLVKVPPHLSRSRRKFEGDIREGSLSWVTTWTPVRNQTVSLFNSVWRMCGRLVGGVGPKMKTCYLLRVKQRLAFCCPLLPNKLFSVFWEVRLLPGVLVFTCSTGETQFSANFCGEITELSLWYRRFHHLLSPLKIIH